MRHKDRKLKCRFKALCDPRIISKQALKTVVLTPVRPVIFAVLFVKRLNMSGLAYVTDLLYFLENYVLFIMKNMNICGCLVLVLLCLQPIL